MAARPAVPRLLHVFSNFVASGPELRTVALMNAFGPRFKHLVVSMDGRTSALEHVDASVDLRVIQISIGGGVLGAARTLGELLRRESPDVLLTYNWGAFDGLLAALFAGWKRLIHHEDGFNADEAVRLKLRRTWARRIVLPQASCVVVPSLTLARIAETRWKVTPPRLRLIPNGVDVTRLEPRRTALAVRATLGIPESAMVLGTVAHLRREKRLDRLVELLASFPADRRPHVIVVGEGPERTAVESAARDRQVADHLHLVGAQTTVGDFLHALDVYLLTSETEQMPVSLLEAMACGLPIVATRVGDVERMLPESQRRWIVTADGPQVIHSLASACAVLISDGEIRAALGAENRQHVLDKYSFNAMMSQYADVYDAALSATHRRGLEPALRTP